MSTKSKTTDSAQAELEAFKTAVDILSKTVLGSFRKEEWPGFCQLENIFEAGCGLPVPALSICGQGTAEIRYTQLLAWFLDSRNPHGLRGQLCRAVFSPVFKEMGVKLPSFNKVHVTAEVGLGETEIAGIKSGNSLDILIEGVGDWIICIEHKVGSAEGAKQLTRYNQALREKFDPDRLLCFYLTPDGKAGSEDNWIPISYLEIIQRMSSILDTEVLYPAARFNLKAFLWDLLLGPLARDTRWMEKFRGHVKRVVKDPDRHFADFSSWLERYQLNENARRIILRLVEV
jgi:hypothetical protein